MRLATWNVNSVQARLPRLLGWLDEARPDVLCLQETKAADARLPRRGGRRAGLRGRRVTATAGGTGWPSCPGSAWTTCAAGFPASRASPTRRPGPSPPPARGCRVWSVYVPNGRALDSPHLAYKLSWLAALRERPGRAERGRRPRRCAVCGDFNIAPSRRRRLGPGRVHRLHPCHPGGAGRAGRPAGRSGSPTSRPGRSRAEPFTYWDYRAGMFHKGMGMRIDLVLASAPAGRRGQGRLYRPGSAQGQGAVRPCPGRGGPGPPPGPA